MSFHHQHPHPSSRVVSVRLDPETIARLDALSARTQRSRGIYLRTTLRAMLPVLEQEHWQQTMAQVEDDELDQQFREITYQLLETEDSEHDSAKPRRWRVPPGLNPSTLVQVCARSFSVTPLALSDPGLLF